jgi:hypothetical protein
MNSKALIQEPVEETGIVWQVILKLFWLRNIFCLKVILMESQKERKEKV